VPFAVSAEHRAFADTVGAFARERNLGAFARQALAPTNPTIGPPPFWSEFAQMGWLGLPVEERWGGHGYGLLESAILLERLAAVNVPGPLLPSLIATAILQEAGSDVQRERFLVDLVAGRSVAAVHIGVANDPNPAGGTYRVYGGAAADVFLLPLGQRDLVLATRSDPHFSLRHTSGIDPTRAIAVVAQGVAAADPARIMPDALPVARRVAWSLAAAEAAGGIRACADRATDYAKTRIQFGRPIGSFQAVKHHCANMFVDAELAAASAWDAVQAAVAGGDEAVLAAAAAALLVFPTYVRSAGRLIQVLGGLGFTWEHDAHIFFRRATALRGFYQAEPAAADEVNRLTADGVERTERVELPESARAHRAQVRQFIAEVRDAPPEAQRVALVDSGYLVPHWPRPWGRSADAVEQLVIDDELPPELRIDLGITGWVAFTLARHGTREQRDRWVRSTLLGESTWCQLFSEPEAGSDAAGAKTRAVRVEGGWRVTGHKIWTSGAQSSDWGLATVRTDPDAAKHAGLTLMAIDMRAEGVDIRPLRDITGRSLFNEVALDGVLVGDGEVVGDVGAGWRLAVDTLGSERATIAARLHEDRSARRLLARLGDASRDDPALVREIALLLAEEFAARAMATRQAARVVDGGDAGIEGSVAKLVVGERTQRIADLGMRLAGDLALSDDDPALTELFLFSRCLTIAGGTSEILRNQIAERILGLPREPSPFDGPRWAGAATGKPATELSIGELI
jgi:alkylation response protein AidB-like acyl-CoA dehydrogenase